jgi:hypothetical protein
MEFAELVEKNGDFQRAPPVDLEPFQRNRINMVHTLRSLLLLLTPLQLMMLTNETLACEANVMKDVNSTGLERSWEWLALAAPSPIPGVLDSCGVSVNGWAVTGLFMLFSFLSISAAALSMLGSIRYLWNPWHRFDDVVNVFSLFYYAVSVPTVAVLWGVNPFRMFRVHKMFAVLRLLRCLDWFSFLESYQKLAFAARNAAGVLFRLLFFFASLLFFFASIGHMLFAGVIAEEKGELGWYQFGDEYNFDTMLSSLVCVYATAFITNWPGTYTHTQPCAHFY